MKIKEFENAKVKVISGDKDRVGCECTIENVKDNGECEVHFNGDFYYSNVNKIKTKKEEEGNFELELILPTLKDIIFEEYKKGNVVVSGIKGLYTMNLKKFIEQPTDGLLYDLNRNEAAALTLIDKDPKWVNDYAIAKVIAELKSKIEVLEAKINPVIEPVVVVYTDEDNIDEPEDIFFDITLLVDKDNKISIVDNQKQDWKELTDCNTLIVKELKLRP